MNTRIKQLRDLVVALDRYDRNLDLIDPAAYQAGAATALALTQEEMGLLPMSDFAGPVSALQTMAENIHFAANGWFADLDGTGRAEVASAVTATLLERIREASDTSIQDVSDCLMVRLHSTSTRTCKAARRKKKRA